MPSCKISPHLFLLILEIVVHLNTQYKVHVPTKKDIDRLFEIPRYGFREAYAIRSVENAAPLPTKYLGSDLM